MAIDKIIEQAILDSAKKYSQPETLAISLIRWVNELSDGNTETANKEDVKRYIKTALDLSTITEEKS